jgi:hypothetical protein
MGDIERLRKFSRPGAKLTEIIYAAAFLHHFHATPRFKRTEQDKAVRLPFHQHIQHPVIAVTEIDVGRAGFVPLDEAARAWPRKSVRRFVINCRVCFHLDDDPRAIAPDQFRADEFARAIEWITLKK